MCMFDAEAQDTVSLAIIKRVHLEYERVRKLELTVNPVRKVPFVVYDHEGQLIVEELVADEEENDVSQTDVNDLEAVLKK